jgi:hypothetical protein
MVTPDRTLASSLSWWVATWRRLLSTLIDKARHYAVVILPNMWHRVFQPYFRRKRRDYLAVT